VRKTGVILRRKLATRNEQVPNRHMSFCFKFCRLCFCQILFSLVYSRESYRKHKKVRFLWRHRV